MNQAQIDFQQLRIKHILFKSKVRSALYGGTLDTEFFSPKGPVNTWFNTIGLSRYRHLAEMQQLLQIQQELNAMANGLIGLYRSGRIEQAYDGLDKIESMSDNFTAILNTLEGKLAVS